MWVVDVCSVSNLDHELTLFDEQWKTWFPRTRQCNVRKLKKLQFLKFTKTWSIFHPQKIQLQELWILCEVRCKTTALKKKHFRIFRNAFKIGNYTIVYWTSPVCPFVSKSNYEKEEKANMDWQCSHVTQNGGGGRSMSCKPVGVLTCPVNICAPLRYHWNLLIGGWASNTMHCTLTCSVSESVKSGIGLIVGLSEIFYIWSICIRYNIHVYFLLILFLSYNNGSGIESRKDLLIR